MFMCQKSVKFHTAIKRLQNKKNGKNIVQKTRKSKQTIRLQKKRRNQIILSYLNVKIELVHSFIINRVSIIGARQRYVT